MARIAEPRHENATEPETRTQLDINTAWIMKNLRRCKKFRDGANNHEYIMCSPLRAGDKEPSFSVNAEKGCFNDFAGQKGTLTQLAELLNVDAPAVGSDKRKTGRATQASQPERGAAVSQPQKKETAQPATLQALTELQAIWNAGSEDVKNFPYIIKKGVNPSFVDWRICTQGKYSGWLMIPAYNPRTGTLQAIQYISEGGMKRNSASADAEEGGISGTVWPAGKGGFTGKESEIIICEGAATAATLKEIRPVAAVICAFGSKNLATAAQLMKIAVPAATLIIAADRDKAGEDAYTEIIRGKKATDSDAGRLPIDALKAIPRKKSAFLNGADWPDKTDWNDIATKHGKDFAAAALEDCIKWEKLFREILAQVAEEQHIPVETGAAMFATKDEPTQWAVADLIPDGATFLAGDPKKGKSFLALQMSLAVAAGENFLGLKTTQGTVLHMALEDGRARTKKRIEYLGGRDVAEAGALFAFSSPRFNENGLRELLYVIRDAEPRLIVVDVWQTVKPQPQRATRTNAYEADYDAVSILNKIGMKTHTSIVLVHHRRKGADASELITEGLSGSMGLSGAVSAILSLFRQDNSQHAILQRIGRDYEDGEPLQLHFSRGQNRDGEPFGWRPATKEEIEENSAPQNENDVNILKALEAATASGINGLSIKQLASRTGIKKATLHRRLKKLIELEEITKDADGIYQLSSEDAEARDDYGATIRNFEKKFSQPEAVLHIDEIIENGKKKAATADARQLTASRSDGAAAQNIVAEVGEDINID